MSTPHDEEPMAATPVKPETAAAIKEIKTKNPEQASVLGTALGKLASTIAASLMDEKKSSMAATMVVVDVTTSVLKIPSIKPPDFGDSTKKIGSILGGVKTQDTANLQESVATADQSSDPSAMDDFEKQMSEQALGRSQQRQAELSSSLKVVNGFRNEV